MDDAKSFVNWGFNPTRGGGKHEAFSYRVDQEYTYITTGDYWGSRERAFTYFQKALQNSHWLFRDVINGLRDVEDQDYPEITEQLRQIVRMKAEIDAILALDSFEDFKTRNYDVYAGNLEEHDIYITFNWTHRRGKDDDTGSCLMKVTMEWNDGPFGLIAKIVW